MTLRPATDADQPAWQALIGAVPAGDFLHDWAWAAVAAFDRQPQRRFVLEEDGAVVALAAAQVRSVGLGRSFWYVPHGPVTDLDHPAAGTRLTALVDGLVAAARDDRAVVLRFEPRVEAGSPAAALFDRLATPVAERLQVGQTRIVELEPDEALMAGFDADTRNAVRRSGREGVTTTIVTDPDDEAVIDRLHGLVRETQQRAGFPLPPIERHRLAWRSLAGAGRACIVEATVEGRLLASGMLVVEGGQSFYLFAGSRREGPGEPHRYPSYAVQWAMMAEARARGAHHHDLWGVAPARAGPDHPWHGVGLFKKGFGGREVTWAGSWEIVLDPRFQRLRAALGRLRRLRRSGG